MNDLPEGFKMTELGALPEEWDVVMLGDVTEFSRKPRSLNINKCKKIPFIPMEYIPDEKIYISKYDLKHQGEIKETFYYLLEWVRKTTEDTEKTATLCALRVLCG